MTESNVRINDRSLLIVDDDTPLRTRLARAMGRAGLPWLLRKVWPKVSNSLWKARRPMR